MTEISNPAAPGNAPPLPSPPEIVPAPVPPAMPPGAPHAPRSQHPAITADWRVGVFPIAPPAPNAPAAAPRG